MNFINARFYKPFSLIRSMSLIKNVYNVTEAAGMNTTTTLFKIYAPTADAELLSGF